MNLKNNFSNGFTVQKVDSRVALNQTIEFLNEHFSNSNEFFCAIYYQLISCNKTVPYGYNLINAKNLICGSMLTLEQGDYIDTSGNKKIVNLSSWFVLSEYRGLLAIWFHRTIIDRLDEYIITSYTAIPAARKALKLGGFKPMLLQSSKILFYYNLNIRNILRYSIQRLDPITFFKMVNIEHNFYLSNQLIYFKLKVPSRNRPIYLIGKKNIDFLKLTFLGIHLPIPIPILTLIWSSELTGLEEHISNSTLSMILKIGILKLVYYPIKYTSTEINDTNTGANRASICMIRSKISIPFIQPLGSEVCLGG